jgi:hypothetical protein
VCTFRSTRLDTWAKGRSSHILPRHYRDGLCRQIFLNKIITGDETWCFACDPETKRQSSEWVGETSPRLKKLKFQRSRIKTMLIIFSTPRCSAKRIRTRRKKKVNAEFYEGVMDRLLKRIQRVSPAAFNPRDVFLLHYNAPAHKPASVCQFLTPRKVTTRISPRRLPFELRQTTFCSPSWKWS